MESHDMTGPARNGNRARVGLTSRRHWCSNRWALGTSFRSTVHGVAVVGFGGFGALEGVGERVRVASWVSRLIVPGNTRV